MKNPRFHIEPGAFYIPKKPLFGFFESFYNARQDLVRITDEPVFANIENRRIRIFIDTDNHVAVFHTHNMLYRAGNTARHI